MPPVDVQIDVEQVRELLRTLPDELAHLRDAPIEEVAKGWDNSLWRLGTETAAEYAVRIPVRSFAAPIIETATGWVREASGPLRANGIRVSLPIHQGAPAAGIPFSWSVVTWVPGRLLSTVPVAERAPAAEALARALPAFHRPAPADAPVSRSRGITLQERRTFLPRHLPTAREILGNDVVDALLQIIGEAEAAPPWPLAPTWCHGDLHTLNATLDSSGGLGILNFDDLTQGDPAVDLRMLWIAFDEPTRAQVQERLEASGAYDPAIWTRARGWAASSFLLPVVADPESRDSFADAIEHTCRELGCQP